MQTRYLVLILVLLGASCAYIVLGTDRAPAARWPESEAVFSVDGWESGPSTVDFANGDAFITRAYRGQGTAGATLTIVTTSNAKLFGAGADLPFIGNGYSVQAAPTDILPHVDGMPGGLVAKRADESWLILYAYGERRGLLGNGALGWSMAILDGVLARPNDYYKLYVMAPATGNAADERAVVGLAQSLFAQITHWYAS